MTTRVGLGQVERTDRLVWTCAVHLIGKLHSKLRMLDVVESHWPELEGMMQELSGAAEAVTGMRPPAPRPLCLPSPRAPPEAGRSRRVLTRAGAAVAGVKPSATVPPPPPYCCPYPCPYCTLNPSLPRSRSVSKSIRFPSPSGLRRVRTAPTRPALQGSRPGVSRGRVAIARRARDACCRR